jgi:hypothetical protein
MTAMGDSSNAINDESAAPSFDNSPFGAIRADDIEDIMSLPNVDVEDKADEPDTSLIDPPKRKPGAIKYEKKVHGLFNTGFHLTVRQPRTIADAAAILMYGPEISKSVGDLAAENANVARAVDMITDTTENAALSLVFAAVPFVAQVLRNHEPTAPVESRKGIRIPFTQRVIRFKFNLKFKQLRNFSHDPNSLTAHVFTQPAVVEKLNKQGITIVIR